MRTCTNGRIYEEIIMHCTKKKLQCSAMPQNNHLKVTVLKFIHRLYDKGFRMTIQDTDKLALRILTGPPAGW